VVVHALTIGFALSMVFAHAPVIVPAITRRHLPFHPAMWGVWGLLQVGLIVRAISGARAADVSWQFGGVIDVVALLAFLVTTLTLVVAASRSRVQASR
jgi:nitrite reductase (NO-forming)